MNRIHGGGSMEFHARQTLRENLGFSTSDEYDLEQLEEEEEEEEEEEKEEEEEEGEEAGVFPPDQSLKYHLKSVKCVQEARPHQFQNEWKRRREGGREARGREGEVKDVGLLSYF